MDSHTENARPSGIKPPSRLPQGVGKTLTETSQSDLNARPPFGMAPPASIVPSKHKPQNLPEPPSKRKTLIERAAEPLNSVRSVSKHARSGSAISYAASRQLTNLNSTYRPGSASTNTSFTGLRPASRQQNVQRPQTARAPSVADTSDAEEETEAGVVGKRKGTSTLPSTLPSSLTLRKRPHKHTELRPERTTSINTRLQQSGSYSVDCSSDGDNGSVRSLSEALSISSRQEPTGDASRTSSLNTAFAGLVIGSGGDEASAQMPPPHLPLAKSIKEDQQSPSKIPLASSIRHTKSCQTLRTPSPCKKKPSFVGMNTPSSNLKSSSQMPFYLTKEKLTPIPAWDTKGRIEDMERVYKHLSAQMASAHDSRSALEQSLDLYKGRVGDLEQLNKELQASNRDVKDDLDRARNDLHKTTTDLLQARTDHQRDLQDVERRYEKDLAQETALKDKEISRLEREKERDSDRLSKELEEAKHKWQRQKDDETAEMTTAHWEELDQLRDKHEKKVASLQSQIDDLRRAGESRATESAGEVQTLRDGIDSLRKELEAANATASALRSEISSEKSRVALLEQEKGTLISKAHFLEGNQEAQSLEFTNMRQELQDARSAREEILEQLRKEETVRRKLNATILELRGNIRVFARTRPLLEGEEDPANVDYPDADTLDGGKQMVVHAPTTLTATGKERNEKHSYEFDRAFAPGSSNEQVFEDCRELIQSVIDGYNVSLLSYGQTGSGKTYGMSGPNGIIPSSIRMLLQELQRLKEKGWEYTVEASFVEVYNETLNDLLGDAKTWDEGDDLNASVRGKKKEKHEIHHDSVTGKTTVTNLSTLSLWPAPEDDAQWPPAVQLDGAGPDADSYTERAVAQLLDTAAKNRRVAATKANERSSRSHSVFMLTLRGKCDITNESSEGILNLVDLAGSERLKQSGAEGNRMKETQAINKSLSSLGDVIAALGSKSGNSEAHIPYRNSKLTYLLQSSLGGTAANGKSSRTLMLLHLSPLQQHWQESRSSLLFGAKVHATKIGVAKKK